MPERKKGEKNGLNNPKKKTWDENVWFYDATV